MDGTQAERRCARCQVVKPLSDFALRSNGRVQGYCRPCHAEWKRAYYLEHREEYVKRALLHKEKLKRTMREAKNHPCVDCGVRYPHYVMDFDHREGEEKLFNVSALNQNRWVSVAILLAEIAKCDLVCANCHRERTHQRRKATAKEN